MRPDLLLLDVNQTLSDTAPLADTFTGIGLPGQEGLWFAQVLRDGFALTAAGGAAPFADLAWEVAGRMLRQAGREAGAADEVVAAFGGLDVHPDVATGLPRLAEAGVRLVTLSNGAASVAEGLLERAGLREVVEAVLSVEDAGVWKPAAHAYAWALERCGVPAGRAALAAVHPWDVHGAGRAGLTGVLVDRAGAGSPSYVDEPSLVVDSFDALAERWSVGRG